MLQHTGNEAQLTSQRKRERKFHRRSRKGCLECKKRHIRCDETTPRCAVCRVAQRKCSYQPHIRSVTTLGDAHQGEFLLTLVRKDLRSADCSHDLAESYGHVPRWSPIQINMIHLNLFHHFMISTFDGIWFRSPIADKCKDITLKHAASNPVLAHQILALSARHLSILQEDGGSWYYHQALELQCQAISLFNNSSPEAIADNRVAIFLFSHILGMHALCDILACRDYEPNIVLNKFVTYCHLHRGVLSVVRPGWSDILESELGPLLSFTEESFRPRGAGRNFEQLLTRLSLAKFQPHQKDACQSAICHLQDIMDNRDALEGRGDSLLCWILLVPADFISLLDMRCQEALAILACYVSMLQLVEDVWLIGDSWRYLLSSIMACLDLEWAPVMEYELFILQSTMDLGWKRRPLCP